MIDPETELQELRDAKNQLRILFNSMQEGVVVQDSEGKVIQYNSAALNILGLTEEQLLGRTSFDSQWRSVNEDMSPLKGEDHPATKARLTGVIHSNQLMGVYHSNGTLRWLLVTAVPIFKENFKVAHQTLITFHDITNEIESKRAIERKEKEINDLIDSLPSLIGYWDANLYNVRSNRAYVEYFGKSPEKIKGIHIKELLGPELYQKNLPHLKEALSGKVQHFEREISLPNGEIRHTIATYLPEFKNGKVNGIYVIANDVSNLKQMEISRREMEAKLISSSKLCSLGEMAAGMAHEINNPLAVVLARAEFLKKQLEKSDLPKSEIIEGLDKIKTTAHRIAVIIKALRAFSRDSEKDVKAPVKIKAIVDDVLELCREKFHKSEIKLTVDVKENFSIECRNPQISQLLMNLLSNSFDAVERLPQKWVHINAEASGSRAVITVTDSGMGIPDSISEKMMQPFYTTKEVGRGTGLGLSISKGIAEDHQGRLEYNRDSLNTQFVLTLPLAKASRSEASAAGI